MSRATGVIEINGNSYDAVTGNVIGSAKRIAFHLDKSGAKVIDGFVKKTSSQRAKTAPSTPAPKAHRAKARAHPHHKTSARNVHHRTERSRTLMRTAVTRPSIRIKEAAAKTFAKAPAIGASIDSAKESTAKSVPKHSKVQRFGIPRVREVRHTEAHVGEVVNKSRHTQASGSAGTVPASLVASASHHNLERMLDAALAGANSHKQAARRSKNPIRKLARLPRWLTIAILLALALLVATFITWRDIPQVAVRVAGSRAHIRATVPEYTPLGFSFSGPVTYSDTAVTLKYKDKTSPARQYSLTQTKSSWNSESLAANVVSPAAQVQTSQVQGTTVYIYGAGNDAAWVNNGVKYTIKNDASLSSDQILRIVQSM